MAMAVAVVPIIYIYAHGHRARKAGKRSSFLVYFTSHSGQGLPGPRAEDDQTAGPDVYDDDDDDDDNNDDNNDDGTWL